MYIYNIYNYISKPGCVFFFVGGWVSEALTQACERSRWGCVDLPAGAARNNAFSGYTYGSGLLVPNPMWREHSDELSTFTL